MPSPHAVRTRPKAWWLLLVALVLVVAGVTLWSQRQPDGATAVVEGMPAAANAASTAGAPVQPAVVASSSAEVETPASMPGSPVGEASGVVRIAADNGGSFELQVKHAVAVWQPGQGRLRIALTAESLDYLHAMHLLDTIAGEGMAARDGAPPAMLELVFMPSAQAFTQDELQQATLSIRNSGGGLTEADVLGTLQWNGSLPSPQVGAAAQVPSQVKMKLMGQGFPAGSSMARPSWNVSLSVPTGLRW